MVDQKKEIICPKCDYSSDTSFGECPKCGVIVEKAIRATPPKIKVVCPECNTSYLISEDKIAPSGGTAKTTSSR